jgi:hypothetical protein
MAIEEATMEAIYRKDGTIECVYDEKDHRHPGLLTVNLTKAQAADPKKYRVNPETALVYTIPICEDKYIVTEKNVLREMTIEEKAIFDTEEARRASIPPPPEPVDRVAVLEKKVEELTEAMEKLKK